jgi:hypothetical protein
METRVLCRAHVLLKMISPYINLKQHFDVLSGVRETDVYTDTDTLFHSRQIVRCKNKLVKITNFNWLSSMHLFDQPLIS